MNAKNWPIYYYSSEQSNAEIDFVTQKDGEILPIEIKSGKNLNSASLNKVLEEDGGLRAVKFSMLPYKEDERVVNMPLYGAGTL